MVNQQFAVAVHVMSALAFNKKDLMSSESLSVSVNTNAVVIRRLLTQLTKSNLVTTVRGKSGGVKLAKEPSAISMKDIYLSISRVEAISPRKSSPHKECPVSCSMFAIISTLSEGTHKATLKYLDSVKLSDVIKKIPKSTLNSQIAL